MDTPPADHSNPSDGVPPIFPAKKILGGLFTVLTVLAVGAVLFWWHTPTRKPDLSELSTELERQAAQDAEQAEFVRRATMDENAPLNLTDHEWVQRLAGAWWLDSGDGPTVLVFGDATLTRTELGGGIIEHFGVSGLPSSPYFTVFIGSKAAPDHRFLTFQDEAGRYTLLLDDLRHHEDDLFSFRPAGTRDRSYARKLEVSSLFGLRRPAERAEKSGRERAEPSRIDDDIWRRAESLQRQGKLDSLEQLLTRLLPAEPHRREARHRLSRLPTWKETQRRELLRELERNLRRLVGALQDEEHGAALDLFAADARQATADLLQDVSRYGRLRPRIHLGQAEVEDGVVIFNATLTLESRSRRQRSVESLRWTCRMQDGIFLDPLSR